MSETILIQLGEKCHSPKVKKENIIHQNGEKYVNYSPNHKFKS